MNTLEFLVITLMFFSVLGIWVNTVFEVQEKSVEALNKIKEEQTKTKLVNAINLACLTSKKTQVRIPVKTMLNEKTLCSYTKQFFEPGVVEIEKIGVNIRLQTVLL